MIKLYKLIRAILYVLLAVIITVFSNAAARYHVFYVPLFVIVIIFASIYDGTAAGTLAGAAAGLAAGAFGSAPMWWATVYAILGFFAGLAGEHLLSKNYVNIILLSCVVSLIPHDKGLVNITLCLKYAAHTLTAVAAASLPMYLPLREIYRLGGQSGAPYIGSFRKDI